MSDTDSIRRGELLERYFSVIGMGGSARSRGNLKFYLDFLFDRVPLEGKRVLDVGGGAGTFSLYARSAGAAGVLCLEPEGDGSIPAVADRFRRSAARLCVSGVRLETARFQDFDFKGETFDVILLHDSINHLDEKACVSLRSDPAARDRYRAIATKLARLSSHGARLIVTDCAPHNVFPLLGLTNPFLPTIEWRKHQSPWTWARLLAEAGYARPRIRWRPPSPLRGPGRLVFGNRTAAFFLLSHFCLTMVRSGPERSRGK